MAAVALTVIDAKKFNEASDEVTTANLFTAVDATDGAIFEMKEADQKYVILAQNTHASAAKSVIVKAGNGLQGVEDYSKSIASGKTVAISIESGLFKNVTGTNKGKVIIKGDTADIKLAVIKLP